MSLKLTISLFITSMLGLQPIIASASSIDCLGLSDLKKMQLIVVPDTDAVNEQPIAGQWMAVAEAPVKNAAGVWRTWDVMIGVISASDLNEAYAKAKKAIDSSTLVHAKALNPEDMPEALRIEGSSTCYFKTSFAKDPEIFVQPPVGNPFDKEFGQLSEAYIFPIVATTQSES